MPIETLSPQQSHAWKDRVLPAVEEVAEGVWAIPVPIPNNPLVFTYCYAIADGSGVALIDPGWDGRDQFGALTSALAGIGFAVSDIHGIAVTHYHRDHIGLVPALLKANPEMWLAIHGEDLRAVKRFASRAVDLGTGTDPNLNIARAYGVPEERWHEVESLQVSRPAKDGDRPAGDSDRPAGDGEKPRRDPFALQMAHLPDSILTLEDGATLPLETGRLTAMWTPGHTFGHTAFVREDALLLSGDHVLPTITPNIGLDSGAITHSLGDYLGSLEKLGDLPGDIAVLPAHGFRFQGLQERSRELVDHHRRRLAEIEARMTETDDHSVYSIAQGLHWARGFDELHHFNLFAALAETAAHMHYLDLDVGVDSLVPQGRP
ncbi:MULTISPECIES: MBL fold metallo-hydrolase [Brevibacterium]|uniref:Beta-lactamase-like protein n=2 Tax=Brevibacterium casei TaxID=33889 RepID=K9ARA1_9MICO|nr:MBL fold metallo-hydrolase [Brevibacterium casei]NJE67471.1 MBL fold metallo-hydrolase [Brevibacterium sp. LS14]EKU45162.1 beta-lactamase-like protein [Brevibacterium casei S18]KZE14616.1 MBL fold metallo-hydrolase [Brevibacterium casei]MBE4694219.1 MBL fold metallo-hydrolase [Brevibacterium casei]MBY3577342.1 MBL fold metallo-hydrolase [Brevibacterium casei]